MRSKPLQEAHRVAEAYVQSLVELGGGRGTHSRFHGSCVQVIHDEGTVLIFRNAFAVQWGAWQIIIAEHHDIHIYELDEARVTLFKEVDIEQIASPPQAEAPPEATGDELDPPTLASIGLLSKIWVGGFEAGYQYAGGSGADAWPDWRDAEKSVKAILETD
jgi:hypothetical protein